MKQIIEMLVNISNEFDKDKKYSLADEIDTIANNVLDIKTAQYVGLQGYWIRNTRCWSNCYRQKRSSSPEKATWEIWTDCHKEYINSINDDNADWNKYADSKDDLIKNSKVSNEIIKNAYMDSLKEKERNGVPIGNAIMQSIYEQKNKIERDIIDNSNKLVRIASIVKSSDKELSEVILIVANNLLEKNSELNKEALPHPFRKMKNFLGNARDKINNIPGVSTYNAFNNLGKLIRSVETTIVPSIEDYQTQKNELKTYEGSILNEIKQYRGNKKNMEQYFTSIMNSYSTLRNEIIQVADNIYPGRGGAFFEGTLPSTLEKADLNNLSGQFNQAFETFKTDRQNIQNQNSAATSTTTPSPATNSAPAPASPPASAPAKGKHSVRGGDVDNPTRFSKAPKK